MPTSTPIYKSVQFRNISNVDPVYTTRAQIAVRYSISPRHLDSLIKEGIIPSVRLGKRCIRIPVSEADEYLKSLQIGGNKI